jgi:LytS/YehU family sensor histidine kinase
MVLLLVLVVVFVVVFVIFEGGFSLFLMSGAFEGMGVERGLIVTRVAGNDLGPTGGEHIGLALRALTGLQTLDLGST